MVAHGSGSLLAALFGRHRRELSAGGAFGRTLSESRDRIATGILWALSILGLMAYAASIDLLFELEQIGLLIFYGAAYLWIVGLVLAGRRAPFRLRAASLLAFFYTIGLSSLLAFGLAGSGHLWLLAFVVIACVLMGFRYGLLALGISLGTILLVGVLATSGRLELVVTPDFTTLQEWWVVSGYFVLVAFLALLPLAALIEGLRRSFGKEQELARRLAQALEELETSYDRTLAALMAALEARDKETEGHCLRVADLAVAIGKEMALPPRSLSALERGALLHDIGKLGISESILSKSGPLNEAERRIIEGHPEIGARIVAEVSFLGEAVPVIQHHHERWNGSGYPQGLRGEEIPLLARIFAVADAYDAMTHVRPYRAAGGSRAALDSLQAEAGRLFDPRVVEVLCRVLEKRRLGGHDSL